MSKKCRAYSESKLGLEPADNRKAFYAGWDAAIKYVLTSDIPQEPVDETAKDRHEFEEMVKKGTKAWVNTPDDWVDELRGGTEKQEFECPRCGHCCPEREWVGLDDDIPGLGLVTEEFYNGMLCAEDILRKRNTCVEREWVGLEEEEILKCFDSVALGQVEGDCVIDKHVNIFNAIRAIEAKLKEKNT